MSASVGKGGAIAYALNVYFYSGNAWVFFSSARDSEGGEFLFTSIDRSVIAADILQIDLAEITSVLNRLDREAVWLKGREWTHAPDGRRLIIMKGYEGWVMRGR
jgi:hypothetical protein